MVIINPLSILCSPRQCQPTRRKLCQWQTPSRFRPWTNRRSCPKKRPPLRHQSATPRFARLHQQNPLPVSICPNWLLNRLKYNRWFKPNNDALKPGTKTLSYLVIQVPLEAMVLCRSQKDWMKCKYRKLCLDLLRCWSDFLPKNVLKFHLHI